MVRPTLSTATTVLPLLPMDMKFIHPDWTFWHGQSKEIVALGSQAFSRFSGSAEPSSVFLVTTVVYNVRLLYILLHSLFIVAIH
jgi:hypothetical protein